MIIFSHSLSLSISPFNRKATHFSCQPEIITCKMRHFVTINFFSTGFSPYFTAFPKGESIRHSHRIESHFIPCRFLHFCPSCHFQHTFPFCTCSYIKKHHATTTPSTQLCLGETFYFQPVCSRSFFKWLETTFLH